jgi:hypothetical protein
MGTSLIRNSPPLGLYSGLSLGRYGDRRGVGVSYERGTHVRRTGLDASRTSTRPNLSSGLIVGRGVSRVGVRRTRDGFRARREQLKRL